MLSMQMADKVYSVFGGIAREMKCQRFDSSALAGCFAYPLGVDFVVGLGMV